MLFLSTLIEAKRRKNMKKFEGKVALITGGGSGIGRAAALEFAKNGAKVVIANRTEKDAQETLRLIHELGGTGIYLKTDVSVETDVKAMVAGTIQAYGRLDYAFNNAGIEQKPAALPDQSEDEFDRVINVNLKGVWLSMKHEIPELLKTKGAIVNTSSISGVVGFATIPIYSAAKHAVVGLTKSVALEYAKQGVRVNAISPGAIGNTGTLNRSFGGSAEALEQVNAMFPLGRVGTVEEIAGTVVFLCSEAAGFITGQTLVVDGGYAAG